MSSTTEYYTPSESQQAPPPTCIDAMPYVGVWKHEPKPDNPDELTKVPYSPTTGRKARPNDHHTFGTRQQAEQAFATGDYSGLCLLIAEHLDITAGDIDHIVPEDRAFDESALSSAAWRLIRVANTYTSWSPSGTGLRFYFAATVSGYMNRTPADAAIHAEQYSRGRFMTETFRQISGTPDTFNDDPEDLQAWIDMLGFPKREERRPPPTPEPINIGDHPDLERILEVAFSLRNGEKVRRLYEGDASEYRKANGQPDMSRADAALAAMLCPFTPDDGEVEAGMRSSGLARSKWDRRGDDYLARTIQFARKHQTWWWDWTRREERRIVDGVDQDTGEILEPTPPSPQATIADVIIDAMSCDQLRAKYKEAQQLLAQKDLQIAAQAQMLRDEREIMKGIDTILKCAELQAGPRLTLAGTFREIHEQRRRHRKPTENGHRVLASWVAKRTGQTPGTVNGHLKKLAEAELIERRIVNETIPVGMVDDDGVKTTEEVQRKIGYVKTEPAAIITNILDYQRPADAPKHGGKRDPLPHCEKHPNAGTITHTIVECAEPGCGAIVDRKRSVQTPEDIFAPTTQDAYSDDLAATGTDGMSKMDSSTGTVSNTEIRKMPIPESAPPSTGSRTYQPPADLHQRLQSMGLD